MTTRARITTSSDPLVSALSLLASDTLAARALINTAARAGDSLAAAVADHPASDHRHGVYVDPEAFRRFISGGGNVALYAATTAALERLLPPNANRLLDIGTGDGRAALPAVANRRDLVCDAVEPSDALRQELERATSQSPCSWTVHGTDVESFLEREKGTWDHAQATFALHNLPPDRLRAVAAQLRTRVGRLVVVEFDVPSFDGQQDPARLQYLVDRYRLGVGEYPADPLVIAGFLVPVLLGGIDPDTAQTTWERPATEWVADLQAAGFGSVDVQPVSPYWWGPAVAIVADA